MPGLNAPGLVPSKKVRGGLKRTDFDEKIRDADTNHFWCATLSPRPPRPPRPPPSDGRRRRIAATQELTRPPRAAAVAAARRSSKGIMDSVPKVNGIITPKTAGFKTK